MLYVTSRSDRVAGLDSNRSGPQFRPNELVDKHRAGTRLAPPSPLPTPLWSCEGSGNCQRRNDLWTEFRQGNFPDQRA